MLWPGNCSIWNSSSYLRTRRSIPDLAFPGDRKSLGVDSDCVQVRTDSRTLTRVNSVRSQQSSSSQSEVRTSFSGAQAMPRRIWRPRDLFLRFSDEEQELEKRNLVMYKRFIVLLGIFLGSHAPAAAQTSAVQTPAVQIVLAHAYVAPAITMLRPVSAPLPAASFQEYQYSKKSPAYFDHVFAGAYVRDDSLERL